MDNPQAFPRQADYFADGELRTYPEYGMTLRDWFAGYTLAGIVTNPLTDPRMTWEEVAKVTYAAADAMLEARKK